MYFETDYRLEDFILKLNWDELPKRVRDRARVCMIDLAGALIVGSRSEQFSTGKRLARSIFGSGEVAAVGTTERFSFMGAAAVMGHASNAYDIDDGHNVIRAHPGTSFIGGILSAAYERDITYKELLTTVVAAYEATIRMGRAMMEYYQFAHSSGTFGAVGTGAGVGRIYGFNREQLNNVLSVAEFHAPLVPGIRSVEYPSMNKDGVPFGVMIGALAVIETLNGFRGNKNLLEAEEYRHYLDDLGSNYEILQLYFKPYTCCRWSHAAIDACLEVMRENAISHEEIAQVTIRTFEKATLLSKIVPKTEEEAQYNIAYPTAAAIVTGEFGLEQLTEESFRNAEILAIMQKLRFEVAPEIEAQFPEKRSCRALLTTKSGEQYLSSVCEPRGEAHENIDIGWISEKFKRITAPVISRQGQESLLAMMGNRMDFTARELVDAVNDSLL